MLVGAGIAGVSAVYHLTRLGWRDVVVIHSGPLFTTGGSTSHAPGRVSRISPHRVLSDWATYAVEL